MATQPDGSNEAIMEQGREAGLLAPQSGENRFEPGAFFSSREDKPGVNSTGITDFTPESFLCRS